MKYLVPLAVLVLFTCTAVNAQNNNAAKPLLFKNFPDKITFANSELDKAFSSSISQQANVYFTTNFSFNGTVVSNITKYGNMQTVLIQSKDFADAILSITKITSANGQTAFKGRIVNAKYADGYELKKDTAGNYQLIKFKTDKLLQDCKQ